MKHKTITLEGHRFQLYEVEGTKFYIRSFKPYPVFIPIEVQESLAKNSEGVMEHVCVFAYEALRIDDDLYAYKPIDNDYD